MDRFLVRIFGFPITLILGDLLPLDRWLWLMKRLLKNNRSLKVLDVGCGGGAFTIGLSLRGCSCLGLDYNAQSIHKATERAKICGASTAKFEVFDIRYLDQRNDFQSEYDVAVCFETIEHILDDGKLMRDLAGCLKPGGYLFLTTPYYHLKTIVPKENGPYSQVEDGAHVRCGYTEDDLARLCHEAELSCDAISYCSGFLSQKITFILRVLSRINRSAAWGLTLPLRLLPPLLDPVITGCLDWPESCICLEAHKLGSAHHEIGFEQMCEM